MLLFLTVVLAIIKLAGLYPLTWTIVFLPVLVEFTVFVVAALFFALAKR